MAPELKLAIFFAAVLALSAGALALMDDSHPRVEAAGMMLAKPEQQPEA